MHGQRSEAGFFKRVDVRAGDDSRTLAGVAGGEIRPGLLRFNQRPLLGIGEPGFMRGQKVLPHQTP